MKKILLTVSAIGLAGGMATTAAAQTAPMGEELYNQTVQVRFANGTVNNVTFGPNGNLTIRAPGVNPVNGTWRVQGNQLCMYAQGDSECWGYTQRFQANTPLTLTSTCDSSAQWLATAVSPLPQPAPVQQVQPVERSGERG